MDILAYQLSAPLARGPFTAQVERALWAGLHADRLAYAFVGGYGAALAQLLARAPRPFPARLSLCATEAGGAHPRQIATRLGEEAGRLVLVGEKTFATLATIAEELLVVASRGASGDGWNRLCLVRVKPNAEGVEIVERPPLPFAPELPHALVRLRGVVVDDADVLPGDGYDDYLKPFRTLEDTHVLAATVGYLIGVARAHGFDRGIVTELSSLAASLVDLAARPPSEPLTHRLRLVCPGDGREKAELTRVGSASSHLTHLTQRCAMLSSWEPRTCPAPGRRTPTRTWPRLRACRAASRRDR